MSGAWLETVEVLGRSVVGVTAVGAALGVVAWLARRPLRRLPPRLQAWCWWLLAARLLLELGGAPALELAWLPRADAPVASAEPSSLRSAVSIRSGPEIAPPIGLPPNGLSGINGPAAELGPNPILATPWAILACLWLVGVFATLARMATALRKVARVVARAMPVSDPATLGLLDQARRQLGIDRVVRLASSEEVTTPLLAGPLRPTLLLPASPRLAPDALRLVLLHELVHLRRRDGWRALVPSLTRRLLYFHPLAIWAEREHAIATEAACDAEVLALADAPAEAYGELLLQFTLGSGSRSRLAAAWSLAGPSIQRRLEMLTYDSLRPRQLAAVAPLVVLALVAVATPVRLVADDEPEAPAVQSEEESAVDELDEQATWDGLPEAPAPPAPPAPGARWSSPPPPAMPALPERRAAAALPAFAPHAPLPPTPALAPLPALAPAPPPPAIELRGADWLVLRQRDSQLSIDATRWAQRRAEELASEERRPILLFGRGGDAWVVRDGATIDAIDRLFHEQFEETRRQAEALRERARLAREEGRLALRERRRSTAEASSARNRDAERVIRLAALEAERVAELERELERIGGEEFDLARDRLRSTARELELLEQELTRAREAAEADGSRRHDAAMQELEAGQHELAAELESIERRTEESRRAMERRAREVESELERRLVDILERGLAEPLEQ